VYKMRAEGAIGSEGQDDARHGLSDAQFLPRAVRRSPREQGGKLMIMQSRSPYDDEQARAERAGSGNLDVRLATTAEEIDAAQALRYRVFVEEMGATPSDEARRTQRDRDRYDDYCDHLLVLDHSLGTGGAAVVGTYRLLRRSVAERHDGFYTQTEFDIGPLLAVEGELLELGRSCVAPGYRNRPGMQMLWRGIGEYCLHYDIKIMFGCASLPGTDIAELAPALTYLHHVHLAPPALRARALPDRYVAMDILKPEDVDAAAAAEQFAGRAAIAALPPLIKGYLRLGALIGDGAVIDREFNTTDVCIIVVTDRITDKYFNHYIRTS
jgi:putative hemolysin